MGALAPGDLPPAIDLEEAYLKKDTNHDHEFWKTLPRDERLPMILSWLTRVERAVGRKPIIYSRDNFLEHLVGENVRELAPYPLWIAHYTDAPQPRIPFAWRNWTFWQYAQDGAVCGVSGKVDTDHFNGAVDDLKSFGRGQSKLKDATWRCGLGNSRLPQNALFFDNWGGLTIENALNSDPQSSSEGVTLSQKDDFFSISLCEKSKKVTTSQDEASLPAYRRNTPPH